MVARKRFRCTTVGATSVTLTATVINEQGQPDADPGIWGLGTIVLDLTVTPNPEWWRTFAASGMEYEVTLERVG